jgi:hypothetical protein
MAISVLSVQPRYMLTSNGRIFIAEEGVGSGCEYSYHNCMRLDGLEKNYGEVEPLYCPDPERSGEFTEVAFIRGAEGRWGTNMVGRLPADYRSVLLRLAERRCSFDMQVHFGRCYHPADFDNYEGALALEDVVISNYSTDPLGALGPDERGLVNETVAITASQVYPIHRLGANKILQNLTGAYGWNNVVTGPVEGCNDCPDAVAIVGLLLDFGQRPLKVAVSEDQGDSWVVSTIPATPGVLSPGCANGTCVGGLVTQLYYYNGWIYVGSIHMHQSTGGFNQWRVVGQPYRDVVKGSTAWQVVWAGPTDYWFSGGMVEFRGEIYGARIARANALSKSIDRLIFDGSGSRETVYVPTRDNAYDVPVRPYSDGENIMITAIYPEVTQNPNPRAYIAYTYNGDTWVESPIRDAAGNWVRGFVKHVFAFDRTHFQAWVTQYENPYVRTTPSILWATDNAGRTWRQIGRIPTSMRYDAPAHPAFNYITRNIGYLVALRAAGGRMVIWRTTDGGCTWRELPDDGSTLDYSLGPERCGNFALWPGDPNRIVAAGGGGGQAFGAHGPLGGMLMMEA